MLHNLNISAIIKIPIKYGNISVKAALRIIDIMQAKGYEFVTVDELLLD